MATDTEAEKQMSGLFFCLCHDIASTTTTPHPTPALVVMGQKSHRFLWNIWAI